MFHFNKTLKSFTGNLARQEQVAAREHDNDTSPDLIDALNQTIFELDERYHWSYLNSEWARLTGYSVDETLGTSILDYVHPDDKEQVITFLKDVHINNPHSSSIRSRLLATDNQIRWAHIRANCFPDPVYKNQHLVGMISDISVRVREYGLHLANYRTLSTLINNLCGLVYRGRNDRDWTMEFVSDGCLELTGYPASQLVNQTVTFGSLIVPNDRDLVWTNVQTALRENRPYELNYRIRTSEGTEKWVWERGKGNFSTNGELLSIEGFIVDITDYKRNRIKEIEELLYRTRTKLPQKHLFLDRLNIAIQRCRSVSDYEFALLIIHIDRFKKLQDLFPADIIDRIVMDVSSKISEIICETDSLCLYGEGEYALLMEHVTSLGSIRNTVSTIQELLLKPVKIKTTETYITASIGVYSSKDVDNDRKTVIKNAYTAMNRAKSLGGSRYEFFDENTNNRVYALDRMEKEILVALQNDELLLCYQPLVPADNVIEPGFETQLYWQHPRRGKIPSQLFSPVNSNNRIVTEINDWLLEHFFQQLTIWQTMPDFNLSLDISLRFFGENVYTPEFLEKIEVRLKNAALQDRYRLSLILDENDIRTLKKDAIDVLSRLHKNRIGLVMAIGRSSMPPEESPVQLPVHTIKIDCPILKKDSSALQFTNAKINYIKALGKKVIINGIDTKEKLGLIKLLDYDYIQGDLVSPPLDSEQVLQTLIGEYAVTGQEIF